MYWVDIFRAGRGRNGESTIVRDIPTEAEAVAVAEQTLFHPHSEYANERRHEGDEVYIMKVPRGKRGGGTIFSACGSMAAGK